MLFSDCDLTILIPAQHANRCNSTPSSSMPILLPILPHRVDIQSLIAAIYLKGTPSLDADAQHPQLPLSAHSEDAILSPAADLRRQAECTEMQASTSPTLTTLAHYSVLTNCP
jgi:hypothetical protein